jgi:2'-5' RNA ligase
MSLAVNQNERGIEMSLGKHGVDAPADRWRVFCAIELPQETRLAVMRYVSHLRESVPDVRASWSRESGIHLTLKFLGEVPAKTVTDFSAAISRAVTGIEPFSVLLGGKGVFPKRRDPRVLWIGVKDSEGKFEELHLRVETESFARGFAKEKKRFHPHLTLARLRSQQNVRELVEAHEVLAFDAQEIRIAELVVFRSELSSSGSRYTVISRHALKRL